MKFDWNKYLEFPIFQQTQKRYLSEKRLLKEFLFKKINLLHTKFNFVNFFVNKNV